MASGAARCAVSPRCRPERMRGIECAVDGCAHVHAENDDLLVRAVLEHALTRHPQLGYDERRARAFVRAVAYDDTEHAPRPFPGRSAQT